MSNDTLRDLSQNPLVQRLGVTCIPVLRRHSPGAPLLTGPALVGVIGAGECAEPVRALLEDAGVADAGDEGKVAAVVLDATAARTLDDLSAVQQFLTPAVKRLGPGGRLLILSPKADPSDAEAAAVAQAFEGLIRSAGKEVRAGATANLLVVSPDAAIESSVRFFLSARSAYVDGQVVHVGPATVPDEADAEHPPAGRPLAGRVAVVTGAARGIGAAIAATLARDGASVVAVDIPAAGEALAKVANKAGGTALQLDITAPDAAARLIAHVKERHGHVDLVVHNAGITRDKLLANMDAERWNAVMAVNLRAQLTINAALLESDVLSDSGRIVCVASTSGIAGNRGQTNYAASKAGVIGMVRALAPKVAERGVTINAIAPGFIETDMTAAMPLATREGGRRINSLRQGGLPVDVAETVGWLGQAASGGVTGQVVRVCGQSLLGGVAVSLGPLYAKAAVTAVGPRSGTLPGTGLHRAVSVDRGHLADYARVCGFSLGDALPATYPHVLAFPLQVQLMAGRSFPLPLPGLVHVANTITVHRPIDASEPLDVRVRAERFVAHPKGAQVDLVGEISSGGERVWDGRSTYLARGAKAPEPSTPTPASRPIPSRESPGSDARVDGSATATWRVDAGTGRRYAGVSGDVNPIHLHPLTAKAFGFPRAIAHGMWTAAHALAALEGRLPDALTYEVEFGRPLLLPSTVELQTRAVDDGCWDLDVGSRGKSHLAGSIRRSLG